MKGRLILWLSVLSMMVLASCTATASDQGSADEPTAEKVRLDEDYEDSLPVQTQLALGSLNLEETGLAIDEDLAAEILPLWQAYASLSASDTAAAAEVTAVLNQIQDTMTDEQVQAIAEMQLTADDTATIIQERGLLLRPGGFGAAPGEDGENGGFDRGLGGPPGGGGFVIVPGGRGQEGGFGRGFGGVAGGPGALDEDARATRIAEFSGGDGGDFAAQFAEQAAINALVTLLQVKTGEIDESDLQREPGPLGGINRLAWSVISEETGMPIETLQAETAGGATLAEVVTDNGGDLDGVRAALAEAFSDLPNVEELDMDQVIDDLLNGTFQFIPGAGDEN